MSGITEDEIREVLRRNWLTKNYREMESGKNISFIADRRYCKKIL